MYRDVELVWENCRSFNKPDSDICRDCDEAQQAFLARWQQQGLPQPDCHVGADKKKKGRQSGPAAADAAAAAAGKGGKKPAGSQTQREDGKAHKTAKQVESSKTKDKQKSDAREEAAAGKPSSKRKRGQDSADDDEAKPSSSAAAQPKKSKGAQVKEELAPEKMSAGARLRKGLPPTPPSRISPRMAGAEAASQAASVAADTGPIKVPEASAKPMSKSKPVATHQAGKKVKADPDPPVARRSSGRLK